MSDDTLIPGASSGIGSSDVNSSANRAATGLAEDFDTFLTLLTTQLQQQDPTQPMDTNEFTAQIVQFTSVEQAVNTNQNLERLIELTENQFSGLDQGTAVNYLGKQIAVDGATRTSFGGSATWPFEAQGNAVLATVGIYDSDGDLTSIEEVTLAGEGSYNYDWNGIDLNGNLAPDGEYTIQIVAFDEDGRNVPINTDAGGIVTAVDFVNGDYVMRLENGEEYTLDKVLRVTDNPNAAAATQTAEDPLSYLGRNVTIDVSSQFNSGAGASYQFGLNATPQNTNIRIVDENGTIVQTDTMNITGPGVYTYNWDGTDQSGRPAQPGTYSILIDSFDANGVPLQSTTQTTGTVTAIDFANGSYRVRLDDGSTHDIDSIQQVLNS